MQDVVNSIDVSLAGLEKPEWKTRLMALADENGMSQDLGEKHFATFIDLKSTLLVTFETIQGIQALSETEQPLGFDLVKSQGWSHLCLISDGDTWFRDQRIYGFFDQLIDDGFFEDFDQVIFYGAGPCGYAAAAFSVDITKGISKSFTAVASVSTKPGLITDIRTPRSIRSNAKASAMAIIAALVAE